MLSKVISLSGVAINSLKSVAMSSSMTFMVNYFRPVEARGAVMGGN
jgi:hypothetical protein